MPQAMWQVKHLYAAQTRLRVIEQLHRLDHNALAHQRQARRCVPEVNLETKLEIKQGLRIKMRHVNVTTVMMAPCTRPLHLEHKHQIAVRHHRAQLIRMRADRMLTN